MCPLLGYQVDAATLPPLSGEWHDSKTDPIQKAGSLCLTQSVKGGVFGLFWLLFWFVLPKMTWSGKLIKI